MTNRERIVNNVKGEKVDRLPLFIHFSMSPWRETMKRWLDEGLKDNEEWKAAFGVIGEVSYSPESLDRLRKSNWNEWFGLDAGFRNIDEVSLGFQPFFEEQIIEDKGDKLVVRDKYGLLKEMGKDYMAIPLYLDYPIKDRDDWEKLKEERLKPDDPERFPDNFDKLAEIINNSDQAIQIGMYPYGLFGTLRDFMGVEEFLVSFHTQPDLVKDMMDYLTDIWIKIYSRVSEKVKLHHIHMWEDMSGCHGSLISPKMIREFMLPNYSKITTFAKEKGIEIVSVDTDGDVSELVPLFMEAGINLIWPFEVQAGCNIVEYGRKYPDLCILGGIDKRALAYGKGEINTELKRIEPMFERGKYFPALDHGVPPEVSWENMNYYINKLKELTYKYCK